MKARPNTWMPMYWADYWADTGHLSAAQHGAYMNLIGRYWMGGVPLPDNDDMLARLACMTAAEWRRARPVIQTFFEVVDGVWRKARIDKELKRAGGILQAKRDAGKLGGRPKQTDKQTESKPKPNGLANGEAEPKQTETPLQKNKSPEDIKKLVQDSIPRATRASRANFADPAVRKQAWEQKISQDLIEGFGPERAMEIIERYQAGDPDAKRLFNEISNARKAGTA